MSLYPFVREADGVTIQLVLLILTFALHFVLVGGVVGGAAWRVARVVRGGDDAIAAVSRDWLPFALGAAITAGVAPLLFVQVLYQPRFFSAALLMSHRLMAIVPALVIGFYLLYLGKSPRAQAWRRGVRLAITGGALLCFVFVAWSWVECRVLGSEPDPQVWVAHYRDGRWIHTSPEIPRRLVAWLGLMAACFAAGAGLLAGSRATDGDRRRLAITGACGIAAAVAGAVWWYRSAPGGLPSSATPWLYLAAAAALVAIAGFAGLAAGRAAALRVAAVATGALVLAASVLREASRIALLSRRPAVDHAQGLPLFVLFVIAGAAAIAACLVIVRGQTRNQDRPRASPETPDTQRHC